MIHRNDSVGLIERLVLRERVGGVHPVVLRTFGRLNQSRRFLQDQIVNLHPFGGLAQQHVHFPAEVRVAHPAQLAFDRE